MPENCDTPTLSWMLKLYSWMENPICTFVNYQIHHFHFVNYFFFSLKKHMEKMERDPKNSVLTCLCFNKLWSLTAIYRLLNGQKKILDMREVLPICSYFPFMLHLFFVSPPLHCCRQLLNSLSWWAWMVG